MQSNILSTNVDSSYNINLNEPHYKLQMNSTFFISNSDNYIGISFDKGSVGFTATSCDGKSSIPHGNLSLSLNTTTPLSYINGIPVSIDSDWLFRESHIQIEVHFNHNKSNTLVVVKWIHPTQQKQYESSCEYNSAFTDTSHILFRTASAMNDYYHRLSDVKFQFCVGSLNRHHLTENPQHRQLLSSTPAPVDFNYNACPKYYSRLSDFTQIYGSDVKEFIIESDNYMYLYYINPIKSSEWLFSADTKIEMTTIHTTVTSLQVSLDIAPLVGCQDPIITIQDSNKFVSVLFTSQTVGFYPRCGTMLSDRPSSPIDVVFTDPIQNMTFDTNNISWTDGLKMDEMSSVSLIFDIVSQTTTAVVQRHLSATNSMVDFKCVWNNMFTINDTFEVLLASSTNASCRIRGIQTSYCDINWKYPMDFCENITSTADMSLWSNPTTASIAQQIVHGIFDNNHPPLNVVYNYLPPHVSVRVQVTFYIQRTLLSTDDIIDFYITLDKETKLLVTYIGPSISETCSLPWSKVAAYCRFTVYSNHFNHTSNSLNISIYTNIRSGSTAFNWGFSPACIHQTFISTKPPTFSPTTAPTMLPTIPTQIPSKSPTDNPTINPTISPTYNPSYSPTEYPSANPIINPTSPPTNNPTSIPTYAPLLPPTNNPLIVGHTHNPTQVPTTVNPTNSPTQNPTLFPNDIPSNPTFIPTIFPTKLPTDSESNATSIPTLFPTQSPLSSNPSKSPTENPSETILIPTKQSSKPTKFPIIYTQTDDNKKTELVLNDANGQCNAICTQCLDQIYISTVDEDDEFKLMFSSSNDSNCKCPEMKASKNKDNTAIDVMNEEYTLDIEKYTFYDESNDTKYGINVRINYWMSISQNCNVSYIVNRNEFFGVQAQNVLIIKFTLCDLPPEKLTHTALQNSKQNYIAEFVRLFDLRHTNIVANITVGAFCNNNSISNTIYVSTTQAPMSQPPMSLQNDEQVTVVIVFSNAEDASAAKTHACAEILDMIESKNEILKECVTETETEHEPEAVLEKHNTEGGVYSNKLITIVFIVTGVVVFVIIMSGVIYYIYSAVYDRKKEKEEDGLRSVVTRPGNTTHGTVISEDITNGNCINRNTIRRNTLPDIEIIYGGTPHEINKTNTNIEGMPCHKPITSQLVPFPRPLIHLNVSNSTRKSPLHSTRKSLIAETNMHQISQSIIEDIEDSTPPENEQQMIEYVVKKNKANEIKFKDLIINEQIGKGEFGIVHKAIWEGNIVVVKQLFNNNENKRIKFKEMESEIMLISSIPRHNNLIEIFGYIKEPFGIVMNYMLGGSVEQYVYRKYRKQNDSIPTIIELLIILTKTAAGVKHLHSFDLVHRDIACRNILLGEMINNKINNNTEIKISDFGLVRHVANTFDTEQKTQSSYGPIKWMAPESIKSKKYSKKSDVYMFGITMYEIFYGLEPYLNSNPIEIVMDVITKQRRPKIINDSINYRYTNMPNAYYQLMKNCWHQKPNKRPSFEQIIKSLNKIQLNPL